LAGLGPMKTVYDPARRQYRNMPTAQQPKKWEPKSLLTKIWLAEDSCEA
jgi:hypothetical protein